MSGAFRLKGRGNGQGHAIGQAYVSGEPPRPSAGVVPGSLHAAIAEAVAALEALMARMDAKSAGILEFQVEMLSDPAISEMAADHMAEGQGVALAWVTALETYIAGFEQSEDDDIRARAVDVTDIRDRVLRALEGIPVADFPAGAVFVGRDMPPSLFLAHDWNKGGGIVLQAGSMASHVALLARTRGVPMVVGVGEFEIADGVPVLADSVKGYAIIEPSDEDLAAADLGAPVQAAVDKADVTKLGYASPLEVLVNINGIEDIRQLDVRLCDGVGLVRTEFLLSSPADLASEERQFQLYREIVQWAGGRPVSIRLLDLGGDKPGSARLGGRGENERNPFLGLRGIRLLLARPDMLRIQVRALLRAAPLGDLKVLLPVVTVPEEVVAVRRLFEEEAAGFSRRHVSACMPAIGIMVEVPAAALTLDLFEAADFFSLGTNDLAQYLTAAARDNTAVVKLYEQAGPALLRLISQCVAMARDIGKPIGVCGDMAGDPASLGSLVDCGITQISIAPSQLAAVGTVLSSPAGTDF